MSRSTILPLSLLACLAAGPAPAQAIDAGALQRCLFACLASDGPADSAGYAQCVVRACAGPEADRTAVPGGAAPLAESEPRPAEVPGTGSPYRVPPAQISPPQASPTQVPPNAFPEYGAPQAAGDAGPRPVIIGPPGSGTPPVAEAPGIIPDTGAGLPLPATPDPDRHVWQVVRLGPAAPPWVDGSAALIENRQELRMGYLCSPGGLSLLTLEGEAFGGRSGVYTIAVEGMGTYTTPPLMAAEGRLQGRLAPNDPLLTGLRLGQRANVIGADGGRIGTFPLTGSASALAETLTYCF